MLILKLRQYLRLSPFVNHKKAVICDDHIFGNVFFNLLYLNQIFKGIIYTVITSHLS